MHEISIILYNIRSAYNVGSIFRTADAAGVMRLYAVGHTPTPVDRFGRAQSDIAKTALGAEKTVPWEYVEDMHVLIQRLQHERTAIVAVEQHPDAIDYKTYTICGDTAFVFGNEVDGLPHDVCAQADTIVEIPMRGNKESLNVSVSVGVVLFGLIR